MSDSDINPFLTGDVDEALYIGDDHASITEVAENEDYIVTGDPTSENPEEEQDWAVILLTEPYVDFCVRFENIEMRGGEIIFDYTILVTPEDAHEVDPVHFGNYLTSVLVSVLRQSREDGTLIEEEINEL